ncbi:MAG: polysulfide reductase NrfD [Acidobacteria bacterium]|nr:polysulfide reductase NrfD [Acidobacteriota bacterium]
MERIEWGLLIVNYLYLGGLSAGVFFVSGLATYLKQNDGTGDSRIARYGAMIAPWPVSIGCIILIFDLGNWQRFYKLFLHFRIESPMSIGSWLLLLFSVVTLINFYAWLPEQKRNVAFLRLSKRIRSAERFNIDLSSWRRPLAAVGFPLSLGVGIYTGVLLGAVQARPFWNTNLVAQLFLFSALSTGCALLLVFLSLNRKSLEDSQIRFLYTLDICFIIVELFIALPYVIHGELSVKAVQDSLQLIMGGSYTLAFWVFFLGMGLLVPLALEVWEMLPVLRTKSPLKHNKLLTASAAFLILIGGYLLRYIFVYAGQKSAF